MAAPPEGSSLGRDKQDQDIVNDGVDCLKRGPLETMDSQNASTSQLSVPENNRNAAPKQFKLPILYKLTCMDMENRKVKIDRFSETAFWGLDSEIDQPNRQDLAVIDVIDTVIGTFPAEKQKRKNQSRKHVGTPSLEDNQAPFELGKDFIVRGQIGTAVRIFSTDIIALIKTELQYYPELEIPDKEFIVGPPYKPLVFCYDQLVAAATNADIESSSFSADPPFTPDRKNISNNFKILLDWFLPYYRKEIQPEKELHLRGRASFSKLWLLYQPGSTVFTGNGESISFYKVLSLTRKTGEGEMERSLILSVWGLDFNGSRLGRRAKSFDIAEFEGDKLITQLAVRPIRYMRAEDGDEKALTERGKWYHEIIRQAPIYLQYKGALSSNHALQYSGKVIIDPTQGKDRSPMSSNELPRLLGTIAPSNNNEVTSTFEEPKDTGGGPLYSKFNDVALSEEISQGDEEMYLLMPSKVWGFALGKHQWAEFDIRCIHGLNREGSPFRSLVIEDAHLDLIRALGVTEFTQTHMNSFGRDLVEGKGQGRIVLLHGPPGVGKTLTVECLADDLNKPLLNLTVANIGTQESEMEIRLSGWLDLAQRWNAIVLIDEADTYLARREQNQLQRSALVTAFLRSLEYFSGLMFLTTNQPGFIDDAFNSRIHLVIEYPQLDEDKRSKIWQSFLHKLHRDQEGRTEKDFMITIFGDVQNYVTTNDDVKALELNGRDIRNAFHSAIQTAIYRTETENKRRGGEQPVKSVELTVDDIKKVIDNKAAYRAYLTYIHGHDEESRALERGSRRSFKSGHTGSSWN
ncbi:hypothetical protein N7451_000478 [Penicillium sp. IBT 35674x]|nr:hypothetical protein N7451_000478 [Penicillium sp. IBT 35674x]